MNYYERHIGDYLKDTAHLSLLQHGVYARLLDVYYTREGGLPEAEAARLIGARSKDERDAVRDVLAEFFTLTAGVWLQSRCDAEIARFHDKQEKARRSAEARWSESGRNANASRSGDAKRMRTHSEGNALQTPDTKHQSHSEAIASGGKPPADMSKDELWAAGKSLLAQGGMPDAQCGSFLGRLVKDYRAIPDLVVDAVRIAVVERPADPASFLKATCQRISGERRPANKQEAIEASNKRVGDRWLEEQGAA